MPRTKGLESYSNAMSPLLGVFIFSMIIAGSLKNEFSEKKVQNVPTLHGGEQFKNIETCYKFKSPAGGWDIKECSWEVKISKADWNELADDWTMDYEDWE